MKEALKLALDYIVATNKSSEFWLVPGSNLNNVVTTIKEALAQPPLPVQEPDELTIAYMSGFYVGKKKRPWVGLTKANMRVLIEQARVVPKQLPCPDYNERLLMLTNAVLQELNT